MIRLLYVSSARLIPGGEERELADIVAVARPRNLAAGVTGALVHTGRNFAQVLEGPGGEVDQIMGSILVDRRHTAVSIVGRSDALARSFPNWGMVLVDAHPHTQRYIDMLTLRESEEAVSEGFTGLIRCLSESASARI